MLFAPAEKGDSLPISGFDSQHFHTDVDEWVVPPLFY